MMSSFTLGLLTIFGFISANSRAVSSKLWNAAHPKVCSESTTARDAICLEGDSLFRWLVELDCTVPNTLTVRYTNGDGDTIENDGITRVLEVRLECHHNANQSTVCAGSGFTLSQTLGGPFVFNNLSGAGVLPGWTCNIAGCFSQNDGDELFFRTEPASCTLPLADPLVTQDDSTTTEDAAYSDNSTGVTEVSTSSATVDLLYDTTDEVTIGVTEVSTSSATVDLLYNTTDEVTIGQESALNMHPGSYLTVLVVTLTLFIVVAVLMGGIIFSRRRWQRARKTALILYNKQNMIFDPNFHPAVKIDSQDFFATPRMSISSLNLLQSLRPTHQVNVYVEAGDMKEDEILLKIEHESIHNCIRSKSYTSVVQGEISNDNVDVHTYHSQVFEDHRSLQSMIVSSKDDEVSSVHTESDASSERSYKVLSSDDHKTMESSKLESPSEDNCSVKTEVMSDNNQIGSINRNNSLCSNNGHSSDNEYVQSNAFYTQVFPTESHVISTSNDFELDVVSSGEVYDNSKNLQSSDQTAYYDFKTSVNVCQSPFYMCRDDSDSEGDTFHVKTLESADVEPNNEKIHRVKVEDPNSTLTNNYIILHPPLETSLSQDSDGLDYLSGEFQPKKADNNSQCSTSRNVLSSSTPYKAANFKVNLDMFSNSCADADLYGYIPSETLTREILVPASLALPSEVTTGFTVHLDFDNRCKLSSDLDNDVEMDWKQDVAIVNGET